MKKLDVSRLPKNPTLLQIKDARILQCYEEIAELSAALKAMVIHAEYRYPHFEDENTEAHAALVNARALLDMGEPPK